MSEDYLNSETDIAIVGMACRFPDAENPDEYWNNLRNGHESRTDLTDEELKAAGLSQDLIDNPNYVKAGMFLKGVENFDAGFFGFSPLDAKIMDPQHRHFLECSWEAFENAGYNPENIAGAVGVFAGSGQNGYLPYNVQTNPELEEEVGFFLLRHTGNDKDFLATRASYLFNLKGPSVNVQTACSTSLVAIHTAVQGLLNGECDMALAAGVTIELNKLGYLFKASEILSSDGHCRPFEADSDGTVFGSGIGAVILKRLEDAQRDGDNIHAIIKSSAINNDGAGKVSYLAPSVDGHAAAAREALEIGGIDPDTVTYIECHGTGTLLGDPIEVAALSQAYSTALETEAPIAEKQFCGIGSVKSNIGHTDTAAGVASLMKVVGCLKNRQLVPTLHYNNPNPSIDFANSPFYVNAELKDWQSTEVLRAGVSSLGVGGTNAHIILQEAPKASSSGDSPRQKQLMLFSARSEKSLQKSKVKYIDFLSDNTEINIADAAYTLAVGRKHFEKRYFVVADSVQSALQQLEGGNPDEEVGIVSAPRESRDIAFMFAGGGAQHPNMGRHLYESETLYRETIDTCLNYLKEFIDYDLKALLYPPNDKDSIKAAAKELRRPSRSLPALLTTQYAQAKLWQSWGVNPEALIGHSMGENTAACLSGVLSLKDALGLVALRGQLFETLEEGGMLSVSLDEQDLRPRLGDTLDIAAINAPGLAVASGPVSELDKLQAELEKEEISCQRIHINVAAHSRMLTSMLKPFGDYLRSITLNTPEIPFLSNLSGSWITDEEATDPEYWVNHLRHTVRFADGVETLLKADKYVLLEVGPGKTLSTLAGMHGAKKASDTIQPSMRHPEDEKLDLDFMLASMGIIWQGHGNIDWQTFYDNQQRHRIPLPTYSFDHARHWVEANKTIAPGGSNLPRFEKPEEWCYQPVWQQSPLPASLTADNIAKQTVVVLGDDGSLTKQLQETLATAGSRVISVAPGKTYNHKNDQQFELRFNNPDDYIHLVSELLTSDHKPTAFIHTLACETSDQLNVSTANSERYKAFDSLLYLAQALGGEDLEHTIRLLVITKQMQQLAGEELQNPLQSLVLGPCRVIPNENPMIHTCALDIAENHIENAAFYQRCMAYIFPETSPRESTVALRGSSSFELQLNRQTASSDTPSSLIKADGVYLVTGGLGGLGMIAAQALAEKQNITLALMSRHVLPERDFWPQLKEEGGSEAEKIVIIEQLENAGSKVLLVKGDVSNQADLQGIKADIESKAGPVNGIIHTAGIIRDGIIQLKEVADVDAVMAPKVLGTLALAETFNPEQLDFLLLYSSTSAFTGLAGQIDYTSANAFLDCLAHYYSGKGINTVTSINWPAWKSTGMAANSAKAIPVGKIGGRPVAHPFLGRCLEENDQEKLYSSQFSVDKFWLLKEHRIKNGGCLIPGSGYIELARAAIAGTEAKPIVIEKAEFLYPFFVGDQEVKSLEVKLTANENGYRFVASSGDDDEVIEHTTGSIRIDETLVNTLASDTVDIAALQQKCNVREQLYTDPDHHPFLDFGSHWECLEKVHVGDKQALIDLALKPEYTEELKQIHLHPALLDLATAGAQVLIDGYDPYTELYVPVGYGKLEFIGNMPQKLYSHVDFVSHTQAEDTGNEVVTFTVKMYDEAGKLFCRITDFTMQRIHDVDAIKQQVASGEHEVDPTLQKVLDLGIAPAEGKAVLETILSSNLLSEVAISVFDINGLFSELRKLSAPTEAEVEEGPTHDADADPDIPGLEAKLLEHPALQKVFVRSHLDEDGSRRFIAHYVVDDMESATVSELRKYARQHLEAEMVPQHFVELYEIPTDDEGQVDRSQMLDPFAPESKYVAPRTSTEKQLAKIWQDLLGVDKVGLRDNFFDIGGHSLVSIRVIVRAEKKLGVRLDQAKMALLTLEQLAADVDQQKPAEQQSSSPNLDTPSNSKDNKSTDSKGTKFLTSIFGRK